MRDDPVGRRPEGPDFENTPEEVLAEQVRGLRRELGRVRWVSGLTAAALVVAVAGPVVCREVARSGLVLDATSAVPGVNSREFGLFNRHGGRVILSDDDKWGYPDILFFDLKKNCRMALRLEPAGDGAPAVVLYDNNGPRATWRLDDDGTAALRLFGKEHKGGIALSVTADGSPSLLMTKPTGEVILALPEGAQPPPADDPASPDPRGKSQ